MYAEVTLELARHPHVIQVPVTAVGTEEGQRFVYVVKDDKLVRVPVTTGLSTPNHTEINSGLAGSEQVVKNLTPALSGGEKVRPLVVQTQALARAHSH